MMTYFFGLTDAQQATLITTIPIFAGIVIASIQIILTRKWNKQQEAFKMINELQNRIYGSKRAIALGLFGTGTPNEDAMRKLKRIEKKKLFTGESRLFVLAILNDFESLSIAYRKRHISRKIVKNYFDLIFVECYENLSPFIYLLNDGASNNTHQNFGKVYRILKRRKEGGRRWSRTVV
jgi:hypothetical protein